METDKSLELCYPGVDQGVYCKISHDICSQQRLLKFYDGRLTFCKTLVHSYYLLLYIPWSVFLYCLGSKPPMTYLTKVSLLSMLCFVLHYFLGFHTPYTSYFYLYTASCLFASLSSLTAFLQLTLYFTLQTLILPLFNLWLTLRLASGTLRLKV